MIALVTYEKWSIDLTIAETNTPNAAQPNPAINPMGGIASIPPTRIEREDHRDE